VGKPRLYFSCNCYHYQQEQLTRQPHEHLSSGEPPHCYRKPPPSAKPKHVYNRSTVETGQCQRERSATARETAHELTLEVGEHFEALESTLSTFWCFLINSYNKSLKERSFLKIWIVSSNIGASVMSSRAVTAEWSCDWQRVAFSKERSSWKKRSTSWLQKRNFARKSVSLEKERCRKHLQVKFAALDIPQTTRSIIFGAKHKTQFGSENTPQSKGHCCCSRRCFPDKTLSPHPTTNDRSSIGRFRKLLTKASRRSGGAKRGHL